VARQKGVVRHASATSKQAAGHRQPGMPVQRREREIDERYSGYRFASRSAGIICQQHLPLPVIARRHESMDDPA